MFSLPLSKCCVVTVIPDGEPEYTPGSSHVSVVVALIQLLADSTNVILSVGLT